MKICIIGAGITGLTLGRLLSRIHSVTIYEKDSYIGGIARTKNINGIAYHIVGGHCFNSKNPRVLEFVFGEVLSKNEWHLVRRVAKIYFHGHYISYPIEFSVKEIASFDEELAFRITKDFFSSEDKVVDNLADWFKVKFGETLAQEYFIPYNKKIWQMDLSKIRFDWVRNKLPIPNKKDFFRSLIGNVEDSMPHKYFYYPNTNDMNTFIEALSKGLTIRLNEEVKVIEKLNNRWLVNKREEYDLVISTMPLNNLPLIIKGTPEDVIKEASKLKYNKVTTMLWKSCPIEHTWTYYPSSDTIFHRHIHIGNFWEPKSNYTITEAIGEHTYDEMVYYGKKCPYLIEPIDYHVSDHAYIVYTKDSLEALNKIKTYLNQIGIFTAGRFGEWEYYNMDNCIESAFKLAEKINKLNKK